MSDVEPKIVSREEFNRELVQALDELVAAGKYHGELLKEAFARGEDVTRRADAWRARGSANTTIARETPPDFGGGAEERLASVDHRLNGVDERLSGVDRRLDRIEQALKEIRERMATKVELEAMSDRIKMVADGYQTVNGRLDRVADLLKVRVVLP